MSDYASELQSVAWRGAKNFTRWHLEEKNAPGMTLCMHSVPAGARVSRRPNLVHDCEGCEAVYQHEVRKRLPTWGGAA